MRAALKICMIATAAALCAAGEVRAAPNPGYGCPEAGKLLKEGKFQEALDSSGRCILARPDDVGAWYFNARACSMLGRYDEALRWINRALKLYPEDVDWRVLLIKVLAWKGERERAAGELALIPESAFEDTDTLRLAADLAFWRNDCKNAIGWYRRFLERVPDDRSALRNLGICSESGGDITGAEADYAAICKKYGSC
jgi:tetratricopeptide (TPR) repeat protein